VLSGAIKAMGIVKELMEIWLNEVCNKDIAAVAILLIMVPQHLVFFLVLG